MHSVDELIDDLNQKKSLEYIQEKYKDSGIDLRKLGTEKAKEFREAYAKYCNVKYKIDEQPPIHEEIW